MSRKTERLIVAEIIVLLLYSLLWCELVHAQVLPDPNLTPGATLPGVTTSDICQSGWAHRHRHVTERIKQYAYAEYFRTEQPGICCEVDHLIPLELGGSNDLKNLWAQPYEPRPGAYEKDSLELDLHELVCSGVMILQDAQRCIGQNWWSCYQEHER